MPILSVGINAWEDNRDGVPRCYVALLDSNNGRRLIERQVSGKDVAFELALLGLNDGHFAVAWEEEGGVWTRILSQSKLGPVMRLDESEGANISLAWRPDQDLVAVWSKRDTGRYRTWLAYLDISAGLTKMPKVTERIPVDASPSNGDQTYPRGSVALKDYQSPNSRIVVSSIATARAAR